jgi:hypothetical protein
MGGPVSIKHAKNLVGEDNGNPNEVQRSDWNREHVVDGLLGALLALGTAADRLPYLDANAAGALAPLSAYMRGLLGTASLTALMAALGAISKAGDTMAGALAMNGNKVTGLGAPTSAADAATKAYVDALAAVVQGALVFKGAWDASSGAFPTDVAGIKTGWFYKVEVAGTVSGVDFDQGDEVFAVVDDPSSSVYAANWLRIEGAITQAEIEAVLGFAFGTAASKDAGTAAGNVLLLDGTGKIPAVDGSQITGLGTAASKNVGTAAGDVVQLDGVTGKLPAVDGSQLTNLPGGFSGAYADLTGKPTLGTAAAKDAGTGAGNVLLLAAANTLPAMDGSALTGISAPGGSNVGAYVFAWRSGANVAFGATLAGSALNPASQMLDSSDIPTIAASKSPTALTGTWRCCGFSGSGSGTSVLTLWQRIS